MNDTPCLMPVSALGARQDSREIRDNAGRFRKGVSGNPTGRRTDKPAQDAKALAKDYTVEAILTLRDIMTNQSASSAARVSAAIAILDRAYGKPPQSHDGDGDGGPIRHVIEWLRSEG